MGGYCINVLTAATTAGHNFTNNTIKGCGNVAVNVGASVQNINFASNTFTSNWSGIMFNGTNTGKLTANSMVDNNWDVYCKDASSGLTGSGNSRGAGSIICTNCGNCSTF